MIQRRLFRINCMSRHRNDHANVKLGDNIRGFKVIGYTNDKDAIKPQNEVTTSKALYAVGERIKHES